MNTITKEQIEKVITDASEKTASQICDILADHIDYYQRNFSNTDMAQYITHLSILGAAIQIYTTVTKDSLIELLCD